MGALDLIRNAFRSPATKRLYAADQAAEMWASAPAPSHQLAARAAGQGPAKTPPIDWTREQPRAAPRQHVFRGGYDDHEYQQFSAPLAFDGFGLERINAASSLHRQGTFWESCALMVSVLGFGPVLAALQQAVAPILALPRHIHGGDKGLAKLVASEVEEMLVPRGGLLPSPYLPPQLWGTMAIYLRMLGFCPLQHIDGDPDPYTEIRPRFTRIFEPWAIQRTRSPRKTLAMTTEGVVEICNDGKFTMVEDEQEGHLSGAICALGYEAFSGKLTQQARNNWLDFFASPKLALTLPEHVPTEGQAGDAFFASLETIYGPDGRCALPHGSDLKAISISGEGAKAFSPALLDHIVHIFMVLVGSAGTIGNGMSTGAGQTYQPAKGGAWGVANHLIARPTLAMVRGINQGHVAPYCDGNYAESIARAKRAGVWKYPVLQIPVPMPDRDERIASVIVREKARTEILAARRDNGVVVTQESADHLADELEVRRLALADPAKGAITGDDMKLKLFAPDEYRAAKGYDPLPAGAGSTERLAEERAAGGDEAGALAKVESAEAKEAGNAPPDAATDAADENAQPGELPDEVSEGA